MATKVILVKGPAILQIETRQRRTNHRTGSAEGYVVADAVH